MTKQKEIDTNKTKADETTEKPKSNIPDGYEQQVDASFLRFDEIGDTLNGKLMSISKSKRWDFNLYTIKVPNGDMLRFHGTQQLDQLMMKAEEGDNVFISYIDETETPNGTMKIFDVGIQKQSKMQQQRER
jgi:hypothetical protein